MWPNPKQEHDIGAIVAFEDEGKLRPFYIENAEFKCINDEKKQWYYNGALFGVDFQSPQIVRYETTIINVADSSIRPIQMLGKDIANIAREKYEQAYAELLKNDR